MPSSAAEDLAESELAGEHDTDLDVVGEHEQRFVRQLNEQSGPQAVGAVHRVLEHWRARGGEVPDGTSVTRTLAVVRPAGEEASASALAEDAELVALRVGEDCP